MNVRDIIVNTLLEISRRVGEIVEEDEVDTSEDIRSSVIEVEYVDNVIDKVSRQEPVDRKFWGLDASIRTLRVTGIDLILVAGSLVGSRVVICPRLIDTRWIGIRPRCRASKDLEEVLERLSTEFYTKSRFTNKVFDGTFSEKTIQDEMRVSMENEMIRMWDGSGTLLIDGPLFHTPKVIATVESAYSNIYVGLIRERLDLLKDRDDSVVCVVKRLTQSRYLARLENLGASDDYIAIVKANKILKRKEVASVYIGTLRLTITIGGDRFEKYMGYLVSRIGSALNVIRLETLNEDLLYEIKDQIAQILTHNGIPKPIELADRTCKRACSSIFLYLWSITPLSPTYEGFESLVSSIRELGE
ncbi:MAG: DNA double-strand break repair nuclease NurA [Crenarchaeota archaeon]|nr:DNA double-strand break repair nuclease NurA [Thermoproteota archaeon]